MRGIGTNRRALLSALAVPALLLAGSAPRPAVAEVSELDGRAYGAFVEVALFGGEANRVEAAPVVALPPTGGSETASLPELLAQFGPATIFGGQHEDPGNNPSGELTVSTEGETGAGGFVTSSASVVDVGPGPLIADEMASTCTADESGLTASVTFANGVVETSSDPETGEATVEEIPDEPAPETTIEGTIEDVGDRFRVVLNEQVVEGDTITVRAAHLYLLGPIAVGDVIVAESVCGVVSDGSAAPAVDPEAGGGSGDSGPDLALVVVALLLAGGIGLGALIALKRRGGAAP